MGPGMEQKLSISKKPARWILNTDAAQVAGIRYTWMDASTWADAQKWKD